MARGEFLLFLHADTVLPSAAILRLNNLERDVDVLWGGFRQRFSGASLGLRVISAIHNLRCRVTRVFYGDQAMFVRRDLFEHVAGFPIQPILEDVMLSERLRREGRPVFLSSTVVTDSRKFEQMGSLQSFARCLLILLCYELRLPILGRRFFSAIR